MPAHTNKTLREITANGNNQNFNNNILVNNSIPDGNYQLSIWVEDNKGGKSTIITRKIVIDKTKPKLNINVGNRN